MGLFGWDLPPGCSLSDIPGNRPEDMLAEAAAGGWRHTCKKCHGYLPFEPDNTKPIEDGYWCEGDDEWCHIRGKHKRHWIVSWADYEEIRVCKKCGHTNTLVP